MVWNYRVIKNDKGEYELHEVYYQRDDATRPFAIAGPAHPSGSTKQELIDDLRRMLADATRRPTFVPPKRWTRRKDR